MKTTSRASIKSASGMMLISATRSWVDAYEYGSARRPVVGPRLRRYARRRRMRKRKKRRPMGGV
ncbi:MAG: hypothetical protein ACR2J7_00360 [Luteimonas sp.]